VRFGVGDAGEDGVILEQLLEPAEIDADGKHQQDEGERNRETTPRRPALVPASADQPRAAGDDHKEQRDRADNHRERHQPAADELIRRQGEQVERQRPAEDRIDDRRAGAADRRRSALPVEREHVPVAHRCQTGRGGDQQRAGERGGADHRFDRQLDRLPVDQDRQPRELAELVRLQREKRSVEDEEGGGKEERERLALQAQRCPEDVGDAERFEPQRVDVVGQQSTAGQDEDGDDAEDDRQTAPPPRTTRRRPVDGISHYQTLAAIWP
jgi:hypothetical protein